MKSRKTSYDERISIVKEVLVSDMQYALVAKPIFHSDRGFQCISRLFKQKLETNHMPQSMSRVGKCIDNAPMEAFFGMIKSDMFYEKNSS